MQVFTKMLRNNGLKLLVAGLIALVNFAANADDRLQILPLERQLIADQRGIISLRFEVENRTSQPQELYEKIQLPQTWSLITTSLPFILQPGQREIRLQHILIPADSPAGQFTATYQLISTSDNSLYQFETVNVTVPRKAGNQLNEVSKPTNLLPGESYEVLFQLLNTGNTPQTYTVKLRNNDRVPQSLETNTFTLPPNSSQAITVKGQLPEDFRVDDTHRFSLIVSSSDEVLKKQIAIPVISATSEGVGTHHELQGELRLGFFGTDDDGEMDYDASINYKARGSLDTAGNHKIAVQLNSGHSSNQPYQDMIQEYKIAYEHEEWRAKAGHQNFHTDKLIGNNINGTGLEVEYKPKNANDQSSQSLRSFYAESHSDAEQAEKAMALIGRHRFEEQRLEVGASFLHHETNSEQDGTIDKNIAGVNAQWSGESSQIYGALAHDGDNQAFAFEGSTQQGDVSTNLTYLRGDPNFVGAHEDTEQIYLASRWEIDDRTRVNVSARKVRNNLAGDTSREIRRDTERQIRLNHALGDKYRSQLGVGVRQRHSQDRRISSTNNQKTTTGLLSYQGEFAAVNVKAQLEAGKRIAKYHDQPDKEGHGSRQQLTMSWKPDQKTLVSSDYNRQTGLDGDFTTESIGIRSQYQLDKKTKLSGYLQHNFGEQDKTTRFNMDWDKELRQQHHINVQLSHQLEHDADNRTKKEKSIFVSYLMPLDIPLQRRDDIASLCGKLVHATSNTPGAAMVLHLGQHTTVADDNGHFCFSNVLARTYQLQLDVTRLGGKSYIIGMEGTSRTITLNAGDKKDLGITLHPAAGIKGIVRRMEIDLETALLNQSHLKTGMGITNIAINLTPVDHTHLEPLTRSTDAQGNFNILGIPPGKWRLSIANPEKLPKHYFLEQNNWELDLQAGQTETLSINAVPAQKSIEKTGPGGGFSVEG